jgi:hypothetical protein
MHCAQPGQIAQAKCLIDTLHDAFSPLPFLVIAGQIGMQSLREVDVQPFRLSGLGRQPASRGRGNMGSARCAAGAGSTKWSTGEEVAVLFQIELIEIEFVKIPGVKRGPQPGNAMAEISRRALQTSQLGEQLAEASLGQRLESGDRIPQRDKVALQLSQIAASLPDGDQIPLVLLLGRRQRADEFGTPIPATRRLLHPIPHQASAHGHRSASQPAPKATTNRTISTRCSAVSDPEAGIVRAICHVLK